MSIDAFRKIMDVLIDKSILKEYVNMIARKNKKSDVDAFEFILTFNKEIEEDEVYGILHLYSDVKKSNMVAFNHESHPCKYKDINAIYDEWFKVRYELYERRYNHIIELMKMEIKKLQNKLRFCKEMKSYKLEDKSKKEFIELLETEKYDKFNDSFDYITTMSIDSVAKYKIDELEKQIEKKEKELNDFMKMTVKDLWCNDLAALVEEM